MGSILSANRNDTLRAEITVYGTGPLAFVELVRFDCVRGIWERVFFGEMDPQPGFGEFDLAAERDLKTGVDLKFSGDSIYYLRVAQRTQFNNWPAYAWTSPIWVSK